MRALSDIINLNKFPNKDPAKFNTDTKNNILLVEIEFAATFEHSKAIQ